MGSVPRGLIWQRLIWQGLSEQSLGGKGLIWLGLNGQCLNGLGVYRQNLLWCSVIFRGLIRQNVRGKRLKRGAVCFDAKRGERHRRMVYAGGSIGGLLGRLSRNDDFCGRDLWSQDCGCDTGLSDDHCRGGY